MTAELKILPKGKSVVMDKAFEKAVKNGNIIDGSATPFSIYSVKSGGPLEKKAFPSLGRAHGQENKVHIVALREHNAQVVAQGFVRPAGQGPYGFGTTDFIATLDGVNAWSTDREAVGDDQTVQVLERAQRALTV